MAQNNILTFQKIKLISVTIAAGFILLIWQCTGQRIPVPVQLAFLTISLLLTGIPHGALDHLVQQEQLRRENRRFNFWIFSARYLAIMMLYALAWYTFPQCSLFFFLLISCWHFGETDIDLMPEFPLFTSLFRMLYGIAILTWILVTHQAEAGPILLHMVKSGSLIYKGWTAIALCGSWLMPVSGAVLLLALLLNKFINHVNRYGYLLLLQLIIIMVFIKWLPLLPAFALYFAGWHSLITFFNIKRFINSQKATVNKPFYSLWLSAFPFMLTAIAGLLIVGYLLENYAPLFDPLPLFFVFLSLITLPHMEVMHKLSKSLQN